MGELLTLPTDHPLTGFNECIDAARVSASTNMLRDLRRGAVELGRWRLCEFEVTEKAAQFEVAKAWHQGHDRYCPAGTYVSLQRKPTQSELEETFGQREWITVMSDTPDEINDHAEMFAWAEGRILVHGLGLGCVVHGLLTREDVTHIDVVEVDPDVIALTGHYITDPRVTIHQGDCATFKWPPGTRWDFVWHDIWSEISAANLSNDDTAEHGISYATLHRKFAGRCEYQFSWAFKRAQQARRRDRAAERREEKFAKAWKAAKSPQQRVMMLAERQFKELGLPRNAREAHFWMLWSNGMLDQWLKAAQEFNEADYERWLAAVNAEHPPGHRPNDLIERRTG